MHDGPCLIATLVPDNLFDILMVVFYVNMLCVWDAHISPSSHHLFNDNVGHIPLIRFLVTSIWVDDITCWCAYNTDIPYALCCSKW